MYSVFARLIFSLEGRRIALQKLNIASVTQHKRWRTSNVELSERSASWATELVNSCSESERKYLCDALQKVSTGDSQLKDSPATPFIGFAAGIGNLISDLCGLGLVGYVERYARLFGVKSPALTESQLKSNRVRRYSNLGRMCGITLGCLIGMMPLLFFPGDEKGIEGKKKFPTKQI
ncbi:unnamed protein product, partial [Hymenolepis diminuta]|uniref:Transmembrane protein 65 n=1 Tax=Hymenolepis diminuta TaxID=6216 RepID=A0A0R3SKR2_HYMDI